VGQGAPTVDDHAGSAMEGKPGTDRKGCAQAEMGRSRNSCQGVARIGILGLTYKTDTDVVEESFGLLLTQELASANLPHEPGLAPRIRCRRAAHTVN